MTLIIFPDRKEYGAPPDIILKTNRLIFTLRLHGGMQIGLSRHFSPSWLPWLDISNNLYSKQNSLR